VPLGVVFAAFFVCQLRWKQGMPAYPHICEEISDCLRAVSSSAVHFSTRTVADCWGIPVAAVHASTCTIPGGLTIPGYHQGSVGRVIPQLAQVMFNFTPLAPAPGAPAPVSLGGASAAPAASAAAPASSFSFGAPAAPRAAAPVPAPAAATAAVPQAS
jgi:hypothetical protein